MLVLLVVKTTTTHPDIANVNKITLTRNNQFEAVPLKPSDVALNRRVVICGMTVPEGNRVRGI
jgi:hypothetical protein